MPGPGEPTANRGAAARRIRPAIPGEAAVARTIATETFLHLYRDHDHPVPRPTTVDFAPLIAAGQVWMIDETGDDGSSVPVGVIVLEENPGFMRLDIIAILPAHQHRGHGRAAMAFVDRETARRGLAEVRFYTNTTIARNVAFYRSLGYVEAARWRTAKRPTETYVDFVKQVAGATPSPDRDGGAADAGLDPGAPRAT